MVKKIRRNIKSKGVQEQRGGKVKHTEHENGNNLETGLRVTLLQENGITKVMEEEKNDQKHIAEEETTCILE